MTEIGWWMVRCGGGEGAKGRGWERRWAQKLHKNERVCFYNGEIVLWRRGQARPGQDRPGVGGRQRADGTGCYDGSWGRAGRTTAFLCIFKRKKLKMQYHTANWVSWANGKRWTGFFHRCFQPKRTPEITIFKSTTQPNRMDSGGDGGTDDGGSR